MAVQDLILIQHGQVQHHLVLAVTTQAVAAQETQMLAVLHVQVEQVAQAVAVKAQ
jgi:hypothetical protein